MPRNSKHIAEAQKQRIKIKEKAGRYIPGTVSLQILGSGAPGSPASVYLFTDQSRYEMMQTGSFVNITFVLLDIYSIVEKVHKDLHMSTKLNYPVWNIFL